MVVVEECGAGDGVAVVEERGVDDDDDVGRIVVCTGVDGGFGAVGGCRGVVVGLGGAVGCRGVDGVLCDTVDCRRTGGFGGAVAVVV